MQQKGFLSGICCLLLSEIILMGGGKCAKISIAIGLSCQNFQELACCCKICLFFFSYQTKLLRTSQTVNCLNLCIFGSTLSCQYVLSKKLKVYEAIHNFASVGNLCKCYVNSWKKYMKILSSQLPNRPKSAHFIFNFSQ